MAALDWLRRNLWLPLGALYLTALWLHGQNQWDGGYRKGKAEGDHALAELRLAQTEQALQVANTNHAQLLLQIERADQAEGQLLQVQQQVARLQTQLQERIPHVTTVYRPAPAAEPVAIPRCVFTAGWLRDFNLALGGADLPGTAQGPGARIAAATTWAAPGSAEELLESGVTPADILAFAQDYGRWSQGNLAQLIALQTLHKD
ncbi:lysis protein [Metapseudomonas otitidis]|uniref:lysis protein n=1 Tax=Metapseudomonas otitidis TaxID=319939 RepID=UPI0024493085|nr:lysis protein [Pseudomonas otitidis]MDG9783691.1 lysis protein [Pseudomonas otitidis]